MPTLQPLLLQNNNHYCCYKMYTVYSKSKTGIHLAKQGKKIKSSAKKFINLHYDQFTFPQNISN